MRMFAQSRPGTLRFTVRDEDGVSSDATNAPTVNVYDDSSALVQTGTAVDVGVGEYTFILGSAVRDTMGVYSVEWLYVVSAQTYTARQSFEVVSDYLFDVAQLRAHDVALDDDERYTAEMIRAARDAATQRIENAAQVGFVQHTHRAVLSGNGRIRLLLPNVRVTELLAVWVDDVSIDVADVLILDAGVIEYDLGWTSGTNNVEVQYVHGWESVPDPVRQASMTLAIEYLVQSALPARATAQSTDLGEFRITVANVDAGRDTGIPDVDAVIARFGARRPGMG